MNLSKFFDPYNSEHIRAFKHLQENGAWPKEFFDKVKENISQDPHWYVSIQIKMAQAWMKHFLEKEGE